MYGGRVKPVRSNGTRWIDHKVRAMGRVVQKFSLHVQHLKRTIPTIKSSNNRATVQGKLNKLVDAKVLLRSTFLTRTKNDLKFRILQNISYFISTWLTSEFLSFVFVSVTAFEIFTGEKIFAYLHHCRIMFEGVSLKNKGTNLLMTTVICGNFYTTFLLSV